MWHNQLDSKAEGIRDIFASKCAPNEASNTIRNRLVAYQKNYETNDKTQKGGLGICRIYVRYFNEIDHVTY